MENLRRTHTHLCRHMHKCTLSLSLHTHPSESPASLPPLVSVSLGKKKQKNCKNHSSLRWLRFCPPVSPSSSSPSSTSSLPHSSFLPLPLQRTRTSYPDTRTFKWKPPYFPVLSSPPPPPLSSHFTPLFLFSAFLPCCLP